MESQSTFRPKVRAAVYDDVACAQRAVENLQATGFRNEQMSVVCSDEAVLKHFPNLHDDLPSGSHTREAATTGGMVGLALGSLVALTGIVATGGIGLFAAGAIAGSGLTGSFVGAMLTRGMESETADFYDQALRSGQILLVVEDHPDSPPLDEAMHAMQAAGSVPFVLRGEG